MSGQNHLDDETRERYERELAQHYGEPVIPVSKACRAIYEWLDVVAENHLEYTDETIHRDYNLNQIAKAWFQVSNIVRIQAMKSALLCRLLYADGEVRTKKCPKHKGVWWGCGGDCLCVDECGNNTGWMPNDMEDLNA